MLEIFQYDFMVRAMIAGVIIAAIAPMLGIFLVTRRYAYMADVLAHASLAGVAVSHALSLPPIGTALIASMLSALLVERLRFSKVASGESALALMLAGSMALAAVFISIGGSSVSLSSLLFGSVTTVSMQDVQLLCVLASVVIAVVLLLYRKLFAASLDEELALSSGLPVRSINMILVALSAMTVSLSMRIVGVLLIGALMVVPVLAAMQWRCGFAKTMGIAIGISVGSVLCGLLVSYYAGIASGGSIVLIAIALFFCSRWLRSLH